MVPGPKSPQTDPNMAILVLSWPILDATCCQLGPSCVHLGPIFAKNLHQIAPEISRNAPRDHKTTQGVTRGAPGFSMFSAGSPLILHGLPASSSRHVAAWRAQRIRYPPPRGAVVGRVCLNLGVQLVQVQFFQLYLSVLGGPQRAPECTGSRVSPYLIPFFDLR